MRKVRFRSAAALIGLAVLAFVGLSGAADAQIRRARPAPTPLVVELFTAQGCGSCLQANQMLGEIAERDRVIALTFPVDYWDYLGWRDTFAKPEFTNRQRAYVGRMGLKEIYTPAVVVNGRREAPGVDGKAIEDLLDAEDGRRSQLRRPSILVRGSGERIAVGSGSAFAKPADVWLVRYDPTRRDVRVRTGDNQGKTIPHLNVVREMVRLGAWNGSSKTYLLPNKSAKDLRTVILVQGADGGPILSARLLPAQG